jgi:hypothetical protein
MFAVPSNACVVAGDARAGETTSDTPCEDRTGLPNHSLGVFRADDGVWFEDIPD